MDKFSKFAASFNWIWLLVIGAFILALLSPGLELSDIISNAILLITAGIILWYTQETYLLRREAQQNTLLGAKPVVVINEKESKAFALAIHNIGNGPALNIEFRVSQFHPKGGYTNLRDLLSEKSRNFYTLGSGQLKLIQTDSEVFNRYMTSKDDEFKHGVKGQIAIILTYEDIFRNKYATILRATSITEGERGVLLKDVLITDYSDGNLENLPTHSRSTLNKSLDI